MKFVTINPTTEQTIAEYEIMSYGTIGEILEAAHVGFTSWKSTSMDERKLLFRSLADVLRLRSDEFAKLMVTEMGKPIKQAIAEVEKCAWTCEVYAEKADEWLESENVTADGKEHKVIFQPLGVILAVMPWNFPFWQVFRFAIPSIMVGNTAILKHSNNVPGCSLAIAEAFTQAGFPKGVFTSVLADHEQVGEILESDYVQGVSLTGSTYAGSKIAETAGKNLKKVVLELGGSDPFIILEDADLDFVVKNAVFGRTQNNGQSCIAAKRFIVHESIASDFSGLFAKALTNLKVGDPMDPDVDIGPMANVGEYNLIKEQLKDAIEQEGIILAGGEIPDKAGYFVEPTLVTNTNSNMKIVKEEVFGPVAPVITFSSDVEAIKLANNTEFGLGGSIWGADEVRTRAIAAELECGSVFINSIVKSDPRMPFGGVKKSGMGRELSKYGLKEFVNVKAINIYSHQP
ncbi:MAG: Succinate semialdehyde dehydrogenase [NAD(P)+] Sad [Candidatus Heimdallarchaeota archaeon LC_2]|nr:MAG: Succinate semialdehyde dehydrogenase [NAD(P)+] Sad [Candidatus Heimdallarchaeota archaeon LC_2]